MAWRCVAQEIDHLPSKHKTLSSKPSTTTKTKDKYTGKSIMTNKHAYFIFKNQSLKYVDKLRPPNI
jgi:hypothetical protein